MNSGSTREQINCIILKRCDLLFWSNTFLSISWPPHSAPFSSDLFCFNDLFNTMNATQIFSQLCLNGVFVHWSSKELQTELQVEPFCILCHKHEFAMQNPSPRRADRGKCSAHKTQRANYRYHMNSLKTEIIIWLVSFTSPSPKYCSNNIYNFFVLIKEVPAP